MKGGSGRGGGGELLCFKTHSVPRRPAALMYVLCIRSHVAIVPHCVYTAPGLD